MTYEVVRTAGGYAVEAIDYKNERVIYRTIFFDPLAEDRARDYAAWKNGEYDG